MRIALVVRRLNVSGGTQKLVGHLARSLQEQGHIVTLYTFSYAQEACYPELFENLTVVEAVSPYVAKMKETGAQRGLRALILNYWNENRAARDLALQISSDTDVLNPHDQLAYRVTRYYKKHVRRIPSIWTMNDMPTRQSALAHAMRFDPTLRPSPFKHLLNMVIDWYEYLWFIRLQDMVVVLDTRNKREVERQFPGVPVTIIRGGLDISEFPYTKREGMKPGTVQILMFAILLPHRRFEDGIRAASLLKARGVNVSVSILGGTGDERYRMLLEELTQELGMGEQVHFAGRVSHDALSDAYQTADVFLFPCHMQTWGLAVFEAMASGAPVIVSETSGASEVLEQGTTAMIVPPCSPEAIARAVENLMADQELYCALSREGRAYVEKNMSWDQYARTMTALFDAQR